MLDWEETIGVEETGYDLLLDRDRRDPELLALLAKELTASGFDLKHMIRCICNSRAYQTSSRPVASKVESRPSL